MFNLAGGVDGTSKAMVGILSEDDNSGTTLSGDAGGCINNPESVELVVINTGDVNLALVLKVYACVVAEDTAVGSAVDEGTSLAAFDNVGRDVVCDRVLGGL